MSSKKKKYQQIADEDFAKTESEKLRLNFDFIDWENEYFFLHGLTGDFYKYLFESLGKIKTFQEEDFVARKPETSSLNIKPINWTYDYITESSFPLGSIDDDEMEKSAKTKAFELRIKKNLGRIHGFIFSKCFYIVWFDPAHNLFPGKEKNRMAKKVKPEQYQKVKPFCPDVVNELTAQIEDLTVELEEIKKENSDLEDLLSEAADNEKKGS